MSLTPPVSRDLLHTRAITIHGYRRDDGLYDIEAQLTDSKSYEFDNEDRERIQVGEPLHGMWMRMTVDERMRITACEAATDHAPYTVCPQAAPNFARLAGLTIKSGFLKEAAALVGGVVGCTHLRELLQQMATTAFQTIGPAVAQRELGRSQRDPDALDRRISEHLGGPPRMLNTCLAYATDGPVVRRRWPHLYTGGGSQGIAAGAKVAQEDRQP